MMPTFVIINYSYLNLYDTLTTDWAIKKNDIGFRIWGWSWICFKFKTHNSPRSKLSRRLWLCKCEQYKSNYRNKFLLHSWPGKSKYQHGLHWNYIFILTDKSRIEKTKPKWFIKQTEWQKLKIKQLWYIPRE